LADCGAVGDRTLRRTLSTEEVRGTPIENDARNRYNDEASNSERETTRKWNQAVYIKCVYIQASMTRIAEDRDRKRATGSPGGSEASDKAERGAVQLMG